VYHITVTCVRGARNRNFKTNKKNVSTYGTYLMKMEKDLVQNGVDLTTCKWFSIIKNLSRNLFCLQHSLCTEVNLSKLK
jgi:hypothetical protein